MASTFTDILTYTLCYETCADVLIFNSMSSTFFGENEKNNNYVFQLKVQCVIFGHSYNFSIANKTCTLLINRTTKVSSHSTIKVI